MPKTSNAAAWPWQLLHCRALPSKKWSLPPCSPSFLDGAPPATGSSSSSSSSSPQSSATLPCALHRCTRPMSHHRKTSHTNRLSAPSSGFGNLLSFPARGACCTPVRFQCTQPVKTDETEEEPSMAPSSAAARLSHSSTAPEEEEAGEPVPGDLHLLLHEDYEEGADSLALHREELRIALAACCAVEKIKAEKRRQKAAAATATVAASAASDGNAGLVNPSSAGHSKLKKKRGPSTSALERSGGVRLLPPDVAAAALQRESPSGPDTVMENGKVVYVGNKRAKFWSMILSGGEGEGTKPFPDAAEAAVAAAAEAKLDVTPPSAGARRHQKTGLSREPSPLAETEAEDPCLTASPSRRASRRGTLMSKSATTGASSDGSGGAERLGRRGANRNSSAPLAPEGSAAVDNAAKKEDVLSRSGATPSVARHLRRPLPNILYRNTYKQQVAGELTAVLNRDDELGHLLLQKLSPDSRRLLLVIGTASEYFGEDYQRVAEQVHLADRDQDSSISSLEYQEWAARSVALLQRLRSGGMKGKREGAPISGRGPPPSSTSWDNSGWSQNSPCSTSSSSSSSGRSWADTSLEGESAEVAGGASGNTASSSSAAKSSVSPPPGAFTRRIYCRLLLTAGLPFLAFGLLDNTIFILVGDGIDRSLSLLFNFSSLAAAGLGGVVSGVAGIQVHGLAERWVGRVAPEPPLTATQRSSEGYSRAYRYGSTIGMVTGLILGMTPLLFLRDDAEDVAKESERHWKTHNASVQQQSLSASRRGVKSEIIEEEAAAFQAIQREAKESLARIRQQHRSLSPAQ